MFEEECLLTPLRNVCKSLIKISMLLSLFNSHMVFFMSINLRMFEE